MSIIWLRLKLDLLPCISQEVDKVSKDYMELVEEARKGDKNSYQSLITLQTEIRNRIEEFDRFYEKNYADFRIAYFEKLKLRLRKLLSSNIDVNVFIQEEQRNQAKKNEEKNMRSPPTQSRKVHGGEMNKYTSPPSREKEKPKQSQNTSKPTPVQQSLSSQTRPQTQPIQTMPKKNEKIESNSSTLPQNKKPVTPNPTTNTSTTPNKNASSKTPTKTPPRQPDSQPVKKSPINEKSKQSAPPAQNSQGKNNKANDEVVFMIKMTKEEYMEYQAAKNKKK